MTGPRRRAYPYRRSHVCAGSVPGGAGEAMDLEQAITRLANACVELESAALQRSSFHSRRAERIKGENAALQRTNEKLAEGLDGAIARLRVVLGG